MNASPTQSVGTLLSHITTAVNIVISIVGYMQAALALRVLSFGPSVRPSVCVVCPVRLLRLENKNEKSKLVRALSGVYELSAFL